MKPGSAGPGVPGIHPIIDDEVGTQDSAAPGRAGNICIQNPWPARFRRSGRTLIATSNSTTRVTAKTATVGTGATGHTWPATAHCKRPTVTIASWAELMMSSTSPDTGWGPRKVSSASLLIEEVAEAAVIPARDEIKGKVLDLYVSLKPGYQPSADIRKRVEDSVTSARLGPSPALAVS